MNDALVFSTVKFEEVIRVVYNEKHAERVIEDAKGWTNECEGLTPEEMNELGYNCEITWLVKKSELRGKNND